MVYTFLFYRRGPQDSKKLSNFLKATQLINNFGEPRTYDLTPDSVNHAAFLTYVFYVLEELASKSSKFFMTGKSNLISFHFFHLLWILNVLT